MDMNGEGIEKQEINELKKNVEVLYRAEDIQDEKILNLDERIVNLDARVSALEQRMNILEHFIDGMVHDLVDRDALPYSGKYKEASLRHAKREWENEREHELDRDR